MLGKLVKEKYGTDFFVVHRYPTCLRPLYTRPCEDDPRYSESFDMFLRGEEIASGSRRISDYSALVSSAQSRNIDLNSIHSYLESFKYGNPNHGGCGLGLERLVMLYFGAHNIRHTSLFPRDPRRLVP
jgi:aspartyl-tRNA synthetase